MYIVSILLFFLCNRTHAQDSIKIPDKIILNIQSWPNQNTPVLIFKADQPNGIWVMLWGLETDTRVVHYFLKEKNDLAIIKIDTTYNFKNAFYVIPVSEKMKLNKTDQIELEVWVSVSADSLYYPVSQKPGLPVYDAYGRAILKNIVWQNFKMLYVYEDEKYKIATQQFYVEM